MDRRDFLKTASFGIGLASIPWLGQYRPEEVTRRESVGYTLAEIWDIRNSITQGSPVEPKQVELLIWLGCVSRCGNLTNKFSHYKGRLVKASDVVSMIDESVVSV